jgi:hypothetical protein
MQRITTRAVATIDGCAPAQPVPASTAAPDELMLSVAGSTRFVPGQ